MKRLIILLLLLTACSSTIKYVEINGNKIPVELAVTQQEKAYGLMNRINLTGGMLFVYDDEKPRQFWMKDTLVPLDIVFIDKNNEIVTIHHALPCEKDPCKIYQSLPAQYVLEVNYNFTFENNIKESTEVIFR